MINQEEFLDKTNYRGIFLRNLLIGFLAYLKGKVNWKNYFEDEIKDVNVPFYASLTGSHKYILDMFKNDYAIDRVDMNTDKIPRGVLWLQNWTVKQEEFTNPNVWFNQQIELDDELKEIAAQCKWLPLKATFHIDIIVDSEGDLMKCWESMMEAFFIYKYFTFDHKRFPMTGVFNIPTDVNNPILREGNFGDNKQNIIMPFDVDVHTFYPIFDYKNEVKANQQTEWILQLWMQNEIQSRTREVNYTNHGLPPY